MTQRVHFYLLIAILLLGLAIRLYLQGTAPKGALVDETSFGYIAYSLLETGHDEHGATWPLVFKAFGDNKLPVYGYALLPFVKLMGLTETSIRYPSILAGTLLIAIVYFLLRELKFSAKLSLVGSVITATAPWTFILSRFGLESNLALLFFTAGLATLIRSTKNKHWFWPIATSTLFGLTWYTYVAYRPITLAVLIVWLLYFLRHKLILPKTAALATITFVLIIAPITLLFPGSTTTRFKQIGLIYSPGIPMEVIETRTFCTTRFPKLICYGLHNKATVIARDLTARFFATLSPQFLATTGGSEAFYNVTGFGQFYQILYPLFILGLAALLLHKFGRHKHLRFLIVSGVLVSIIPGLLTSDPQKVRYSALYPFLLVTVILGLDTLYTLVKKPLHRFILPLLLLILAAEATTFLAYFYTTHSFKTDFAHQSFAPGLMTYLGQQANQDTVINIIPFFPDPIIYYAFYNQLDPTTYQHTTVLGDLEASGFQHTQSVGAVWARDINFDVFSCLAAEAGKRGLYATNANFMDQTKLKTLTSENGVLDYAYVYQTKEKPENCAFHLGRYRASQ